MTYPLVKVTTNDHLDLFGFIHKPTSTTNKIVIHLHGTSGNFYYNNFYPHVANKVLNNNYAYLQTNNRGSGNFEYELNEIPHGAALELFEDSLLDIDAWIEYCLKEGFTEIVLSGHSFGTEKVIYYLHQGKYRSYIIGIILLGFCDSFGNQKRYEAKINKNYFDEAKSLVSIGKDLTILSDLFGGIAGEGPLSARSYLNFYSPDSVLSQVMPLRLNDKLHMYSQISVPILAVIGDREAGEYTILPIKDAIKLMTRENPLTEAHQILDCDHGFNGHEKELANIINNFLIKLN